MGSVLGVIGLCKDILGFIGGYGDDQRPFVMTFYVGGICQAVDF